MSLKGATATLNDGSFTSWAVERVDSTFLISLSVKAAGQLKCASCKWNA